MGIPSYYTYLIKNHGKILEKFAGFPEHFYLDANSIIYDVVNNFPFKPHGNNDEELCLAIIQKLEEYLLLVSATKSVTIAFDGVAPRAKLEQQRQRRFKSAYQNRVKKQIFKKYQISDFWDTAKITPGTPFMLLLTKMIMGHFTNVTVTSSDKYGEGEHKIFEIIRKGKFSPSERHVIYGLDSDLIMLAMLHLDITPNIFLFRETPHYIKTIDSSLDDSEKYLMNIRLLAETLLNEMGATNIFDYVFISLMMGNDFMPHFPSLNIRTGGINKILEAYKFLGKDIISINRDKKKIVIQWEIFREFLSYLAEREDEYIVGEYLLRGIKERYTFPTTTPENKFRKFENIPSTDRELEKYINPTKKGWEERYYETLVDDSPQVISNHYLKAMAWNITYYIFGCMDYEWSYPYNYPPLLKDLVGTILPKQTILWKKKENAITPLEQLCYVLPKTSLDIVPEVKKYMDPRLYVDDCAFTWAFCKYFWESHADLPHIDFEELRERIATF